MDARMCARHGCGNALLPGRRLKDFCSYACRGQVEALKATVHRTGLKSCKNTRQNKALRTLKQRSVAGFSFTKIDACTYRLDRAGKSGPGWLMEVCWPGAARQLWVARVGNLASDPLTLGEAKQAAAAMLRQRGGKADHCDWIGDLNKIAAAEIDRLGLAEARKQWPCDALGGSHHGTMWMDRQKRDAILNAEVCFTPRKTPSGDDYHLEYYEDGF